MLSMKQISFIALVAQNTALGLVSKYSRMSSGPKYFPSTVIVLVEIVKVLTCLTVLFVQKKCIMNDFIKSLRIEIFGDFTGLQKMIFLAILYAFQNTVCLFAYDYVDVATYQITYQMKIITTALFMIILLKRSFSKTQWISMLLLMIGVTICSLYQSPDQDNSKDNINNLASNNSTIDPNLNEKIPTKKMNHHMFGTCLVLVLALNSGLAAAYFEKVLKSHKNVIGSLSEPIDPLLVRNIQLAAISVFAGCFGLIGDIYRINENGYFYGYSFSVYSVILLQAFGGLTVAAVVKYSDNVVKNFGTSMSLVLSCILSNILFDRHPTYMFYFGVILVVVAVFIYGDQRFAKYKPLNQNIVDS